LMMMTSICTDLRLKDQVCHHKFLFYVTLIALCNKLIHHEGAYTTSCQQVHTLGASLVSPQHQGQLIPNPHQVPSITTSALFHSLQHRNALLELCQAALCLIRSLLSACQCGLGLTKSSLSGRGIFGSTPHIGREVLHLTM